MRLFFRISAVVAGAGMMLATARTSSAQTDDPFAVAPEKWPSASAPIPFGIIGDYTYPLLGGTILGDDGSEKKFHPYGVDVYYDAWQIGYHKKIYGDMFSIVGRSTISRDVYKGFFFEIGSRSKDFLISSDINGRPDSVVTISRSIYGIGLTASNAKDLKTTSLLLKGSTSLGVDIAREDNDGEGNTGFYIISDLTVGMRIPISSTALLLGANIYGGYVLSDGFINDSELGFVLGIGLSAGYALNFTL